MNPITPSDNALSWKLLLRRLQREKAVLLIGPEVIMAGQNAPHPLKETLQAHIQEDLEGILEEEDLKRIEYYSEDGFFFLEDSYRLEVVESISDFYKAQTVTEVYKKLAQIPFHLVLSLSPDKLLGQACADQNLPYHEHFYDKQHYNASLDKEKLNFTPSKDNRLIYNVFGSTDSEDSLILSYEDLFEFIQRVFNNYKLPKTVEETIFNANCFVFVGFNYSKWYLKLLLRLMNMHDKKRKIYGMDTPSRQEFETFFINEFDMNFTRMDAVAFIEELHQKCAEEDILLQPSNESQQDSHLPDLLYQQVYKYGTQNNFKSAFKILKEYSNTPTAVSPFCASIATIEGRFNQLEKDQHDGVLLYENYTTNLNKIRRDLLELLERYR